MLGHRVAGALALRVRAGDVVQKQVVLQIEQIAEALLEMPSDGFLVREQAIQPFIQTVGVHLLDGHTQ